MNKTQQDISDVTFIVSEIYRLASLPIEGLRSEFKDNKWQWLYQVPHPKGAGGMLCGQTAYRRLVRLCARHIAVEKDLRKRIDITKFQQNATEELARRFLREGKAIDERNVARMLGAAVKSVRAKIIDLTHYSPCVVASGSMPLEFEIGPVKFLLMKDFLKNQKEEIEAKKGIDIAKKLFDYFSQFKWVAIVTVPQCDNATSKIRASITVDGALNILRLLIGHRQSQKLRQGHFATLPGKTACLVSNNKAGWGISSNWHIEEEVYGDNWFEGIKDRAGPYLDLATSSIHGLLDPVKASYLRQRFLDGLTWYGEAVIELKPPSKIIKYVAALERIVVTEDDNLQQTVCKRTALLCSEGDPKTFKMYESRAKNTYKYRSKLMHGSLSPFDDELDRVAEEAGHLTRSTLLAALELFSKVEETTPKATPSDLEKSYRSMENILSHNLLT
jgi:hypothetical protein